MAPKYQDEGLFWVTGVAMALVNGNLDEKRMLRLKEGFLKLLESASCIDL